MCLVNYHYYINISIDDIDFYGFIFILIRTLYQLCTLKKQPINSIFHSKNATSAEIIKFNGFTLLFQALSRYSHHSHRHTHRTDGTARQLFGCDWKFSDEAAVFLGFICYYCLLFWYSFFFLLPFNLAAMALRQWFISHQIRYLNQNNRRNNWTQNIFHLKLQLTKTIQAQNTEKGVRISCA